MIVVQTIAIHIIEVKNYCSYDCTHIIVVHITALHIISIHMIAHNLRLYEIK